MEYNILSDSFVYNGTSISGSLRFLNAQELENLITVTSGVVLFSGSEVALVVDLGYKRSTKKILFAAEPCLYTSAKLKYGEDLLNLTTVSMIPNSSGIEFTSTGIYPRFLTFNYYVNHTTTLTGYSLSVINTEDEINFGASGTIDSLSIVTDEFGGYSDVQELKIFNNSSVTSDIYVGVDKASTTNEILKQLEIAPTSTGEFSAIDSDLKIPTTILWEWGIFDKTGIYNNKLQILDTSISFPTNTVGSYRKLITPVNYYFNQPIDITISGNFYIAIAGSNNNIIIIDPIRDTTIYGSNPATLPTTDSQRQGHSLAWDSADRIYYMQNFTDRTIRYYKISTNTHHTLTTTTFYIRRIRLLKVYNNEIYIGGGRSDSGTETSYGTQFWKINISTLVETRLTDLPITTESNSKMCILGTYIYYLYGSSGDSRLYRYNVSLDQWQLMTAAPTLSLRSMSPNSCKNILYLMTTTLDSLYSFNPISLSWDSVPLTAELMPSTIPFFVADAMCSCISGSTIYAYHWDTFYGPETWVHFLSEVPEPSLGITISGSWISPVLKFDTEKNYNILLDYLTEDNSFIKSDESIGVDNYQIRGSNEEPAGDNLIENFDSQLDPEVYLSSTIDNSSLVLISGNSLNFSHTFIDSSTTPYNGAYITFGFEFGSTGQMQYKFWWNPASNKELNNTNYSAFYLVPFLDTLNTGTQPTRNTNTLRRDDNNFIRIRFGKDTDSAGTFTALQLFNGVTTSSYVIKATTGKYYEVTFTLDWGTGAYKLYFGGILLGSGTIPQIRLAPLREYHTYEFFSGGQNVSFEEKFSRLTINRLGTVIPDDIVTTSIPVHYLDPLYGKTESLQWYPVTVNSAFIPKYKYIQFKLNLKTSKFYSYPSVSLVEFPKVIKCSGVEAQSTGSIFIRYKFPPSNSSSTNIIRLKSWMKTDKE